MTGWIQTARERLRLPPKRSFATEYDRTANSFTIFRLGFAVLVLYSHAFAIVAAPYQDQLATLTGVTMGHLAVVAFFVISGFLVTQSMDTTSSTHRLGSFLVKRALRIMPGLVVCTIFIAFVVGPYFGGRSLADYYAFKGGWNPWWYSFDTLTFSLFAQIPAITWHTRLHDMFAANPMSAVVNGSLWSLRFEVSAYLVLAFGAWAFRYRLRAYAGTLAIAGFAAVVLYHFGVHSIPFVAPWVLANWDLFLSIVPYFFVGAAIYAFRSRVPYSPGIAGGLAVIALLACATTFREIVWVIAVPYLVLIAATSRAGSWFDKRFGDYSYGTYIYAFPVEQAVVAIALQQGHLIHNPYVLTAISLPITLALAFVSWHIVEHPALRLKSRSSKSTAPAAATASEPALTGPTV